MDALNLEGAKFSFNAEFSLYKVTCKATDEVEILMQFKILQDEIEDAALKPGTNEFLNANGTIKKELRSALIEYVPNLKLVKLVEGSYKEYILPQWFTKFLFHDVWVDLDVSNETMVLHHLLKEEQLGLIELANNVALSRDLAGKSISIGAHTRSAIDRTLKKLNVLLAKRKLEDPAPVHFFNTDSFVDGSSGAFSADARYLGNITPALLKTTLLDRRLATGPDRGYYALSATISLRLCSFDVKKLYHVSFLGPKIEALHRRRARPITMSMMRTPYNSGPRIWTPKGQGRGTREWIPGPAPVPDTASVAQVSEQESPRGLGVGPGQNKSVQVANWLVDMPSSCGSPPRAASSTKSNGSRGLGQPGSFYLPDLIQLNDSYPGRLIDRPSMANTMANKLKIVVDEMTALHAKESRGPADDRRLDTLLDEMRAIAKEFAMMDLSKDLSSPIPEVQHSEMCNNQDPSGQVSADIWRSDEDAPVPELQLGKPRYAVLNPPQALQYPPQSTKQSVAKPTPEDRNKEDHAAVQDDFGEWPFNNDDMYPAEYLRKLRNPDPKPAPEVQNTSSSSSAQSESSSLIDFKDSVPIFTSSRAFSEISFGMNPLIPEATNRAVLPKDDSSLGSTREISPPSRAFEPVTRSASNTSDIGASNGRVASRKTDEHNSSMGGKLLKQTMLLQAGKHGPRGGKNIKKFKPKNLAKQTMQQQAGPPGNSSDKTVHFEPRITITPRETARNGIGPGIAAGRATEKRLESKNFVDKALPHQTAVRVTSDNYQVDKAEYSSELLGEMRGSISKLVAKGPYLPGKIRLQAEFGRILLRGMDESALAFNAEGTRSNGWDKETLSQRLRESKGTSFTKILTTDGGDVKHLESIQDGKTGQRLWGPKPTNRTVYSFHCTIGKGEGFVVNIDDGGGQYTYELRAMNEDKAPVWVHSLVRNWDIRVMMSHTETAELEKKFGSFAKSLVASLKVDPDKNSTGPRIRWGIHKDFHVRVKYMRTLTKWRFVSADKQSHLVVTEVVDNNICGCTASPNMANREDWFMQMGKAYTGQGKPKDQDKESVNPEEQGFPCRWYEATVSSVAAEDMFRQNETLDFAEMADWDFESLMKAGALSAILMPAMRMVQEMDSVGAGNDNRQVDKMMPLRGNNQIGPGRGGPVKDPHEQF